MNKDFYLKAYCSENLIDVDTGYVTIMINPSNADSYDNEESFEGGLFKLAESICQKFNKLKTKDINDFYTIRDNVWKKAKFELE